MLIGCEELLEKDFFSEPNNFFSEVPFGVPKDTEEIASIIGSRTCFLKGSTCSSAKAREVGLTSKGSNSAILFSSTEESSRACSKVR